MKAARMLQLEICMYFLMRYLKSKHEILEVALSGWKI